MRITIRSFTKLLQDQPHSHMTSLATPVYILLYEEHCPLAVFLLLTLIQSLYWHLQACFEISCVQFPRMIDHLHPWHHRISFHSSLMGHKFLPTCGFCFCKFLRNRRHICKGSKVSSCVIWSISEMSTGLEHLKISE